MTASGARGARFRGRIVGLFLVSLVVLSGSLVLSAAHPVAAAGTPQVTILSPVEGSIIGNGTPVIVQLLVSNFTLVQPGRVGQVPTPGEGHANVSLDGALVRLATDQVPFALTVTSGAHTIRVELVGNDGAPLNPGVSAIAHFTATQGPAAGVPTLRVIAPTPYESTGHGFWMSLAISNFSLVGAHGQPNAPNEGHIQVVVIGSIVEEFTSYVPVILVSMPDGDITLIVRLANNDNTPLNPNVSVSVPIHVTASSSVTLPLVINGGATLLLGFILVILIIRRRRQVARTARPPREEP